jgi:hypothetical protein
MPIARSAPEQVDELPRRTGQRAPAAGEGLQPREQLRALEVLERRQRGGQSHDPHAEREARLVGEQRPATAADHREHPAEREQHRDEGRAERDPPAGAGDRSIDHHLEADGVDD